MEHTQNTEPNDTPLTIEDIERDSKKRIQQIEQEFRQGFEFIKNHPKSVSIFGSAVLPEDDAMYIQARDLAKQIGEDLGYSIVTGGGPGIMEAGNRGAKEAGVPSLGLTIRLPREQKTNPYVTNAVDFYYFFVRKVCLSFAAEAYVFFPGGFGTMDEFFEILTLVQTKKIEPVPVICVGSEYWNSLSSFILDEMLARGTIKTGDVKLYTVTDRNEDVIDIIRHAPVRNGIPYTYTA